MASGQKQVKATGQEACLTICPSCGLDVREVGFTLYSECSETWMRIGGTLTRIATTQLAADKAHCASCDRELDVMPVDLLRCA